MHDNPEIINLNWEGIEIELRYVENYSSCFEEIYNDKLSHIEVISKEELPITESGYRSIFINHSEVMEGEGAEDFVLKALSEASKSRAWREKQNANRQLKLF